MEKTILPKCSETKLLSLVLFLLWFEFISVVMNIFSDIFSHNCFLLLLRNVVSSSFHTWCIITVLLCLESQDTEELFIYHKWIFRQFLNCTSTESVDLFFISSWNCKNERFKRKCNGKSLFIYGNHIIIYSTKYGKLEPSLPIFRDWKEDEDIKMVHIKGTLNSSDDLTKNLGWVLHSRHCRRHMGHFG